jgi:F-type H+-transporting ATPase subunit gamma
MGLQAALREFPSPAPATTAAGSKLAAIVFGSDQGMCGQLNDQVVFHATRALRTLAFRRADPTLAAVGVRAASKLEGLGRAVETSVPVPASIAGIVPAVESVLRKIDEWHFERGIGFVALFHARPISGAWYRIRGVRLLPVDEEWIKGLRARRWPSKATPVFTMDQAQLFQALVHEYLFVSLFRAFAESLASENASRLASMQIAERNIEDRLRGLSAESRRTRQTTITSELLDIISAFEALRGKERGTGM